jgi:hypothetical protein
MKQKNSGVKRTLFYPNTSHLAITEKTLIECLSDVYKPIVGDGTVGSGYNDLMQKSDQNKPTSTNVVYIIDDDDDDSDNDKNDATIESTFHNTKQYSIKWNKSRSDLMKKYNMASGSSMCNTLGFMTPKMISRYGEKLKTREYSMFESEMFGFHDKTNDHNLKDMIEMKNSNVIYNDIDVTNDMLNKKVFTSWGTMHEPNGIMAFAAGLLQPKSKHVKYSEDEMMSDVDDDDDDDDDNEGRLKREDLFLHEIGSFIILDDDDDDGGGGDNKPLVWVSPDLLVEIRGKKAILEIKNPSHFIPSEKNVNFSGFVYVPRKPQEKPKYYQLFQVHLEIKAAGCKYGFLESCTVENGAKVFKITLDNEFVDLMLKCFKYFRAKFIGVDYIDIVNSGDYLDDIENWYKYDRLLDQAEEVVKIRYKQYVGKPRRDWIMDARVHDSLKDAIFRKYKHIYTETLDPYSGCPDYKKLIKKVDQLYNMKYETMIVEHGAIVEFCNANGIIPNTGKKFLPM